jgi:cytochrome c oxidase assembly factor CtaG
VPGPLLAAPPEVTPLLLLTESRVDPWLALGLLTVTALYLAGVGTLARRGDRWPVGRTLSFVGLGLGSAAVATMSGLGALDETYFSVHMVQHMVLTMISPVFLALGAPVTLALRTLPRSPRRALLSLLHSRFAAVVVHPLIGWTLFVGSPFALYFSGWYDATLSSRLLHEMLHVHFLVVGCAFFFPLLGVDPIPNRTGYAFRILLVATTLPFHAFLGVAIMGSDRLIAESHYVGVWGSVDRALADQTVGGSLLWASGDLVGLIFLGVLLFQWMRASEREAAREDRRLDRLEAREARVAAGQAEPAGALEPGPPAIPRG